MERSVTLSLHGSRARAGVEVDALELFFRNFRGALREYDRADRGSTPRRGGHPDARDVAASSFRLVGFRIGSGIATLEPAAPEIVARDDLSLEDAGEELAVTVLMGLVEAIEGGEALPKQVVDALDGARRAIGDDGNFDIEIASGNHVAARTRIDEAQIRRLRPSSDEAQDVAAHVVGRLHMIEVDQPGRRVGIRAQDGTDWTCVYADELHDLVTKLLERLVQVEGMGRKITALTGHLRITRLALIYEPVQEPLFSVEPIPLSQLIADQGIDHPQGLAALVDEEWQDDEQGRRFLEATLGLAP